MANDNRIDIELQDKVNPGIRDKIVAIGDAATTTDSALAKLKTSLDTISAGGLNNLQQQLSLTASATSALAAAQNQLTQAVNNSAIQNAKAATAQQNANTAAIKGQTAQQQLATEQQKTANAATQGAIAQQKLATAQQQTAAAAARLQTAQNQAALSTLRLQQAQNQAAASTNGLSGELASLYSRIVLLVGTYFGVKELIEANDAYVLVTNKVRSLGDAEETLAGALDKIAGVAMRTYMPFEEIGATYQRLMIATKALGMTQNQTLTMTETLGKAIALSGTNARNAAAGLYQLAMGMEADRLQGQHLKTFIQDMPMIGRLIADALETNLEGLREMGKKGELTAQALAGAIQKIGPRVKEMFERIKPQVSQATTNLGTAFTVFVGKASEATGAGKALADAILFLANNMNVLVVAVTSLSAAFLIAFGPTIIASIAGLVTALSAVSLPVVALGAAVAGLAAYWILAKEKFIDYANIQGNLNAQKQQIEDLKAIFKELDLTMDVDKLNESLKRMTNEQRAVVLASIRNELQAQGKDTKVLDKYIQDLKLSLEDVKNAQQNATKSIDDFGMTIQTHLLTLDKFKEKLRQIAHMNFDHLKDDIDKAIRHADEKIKVLESGGKSSDAQPSINLGDRREKLSKEWAFAITSGASDEVFQSLRKQNEQLEILFQKETKVKNLENANLEAKKAGGFGEREALAIEKYNAQLDRELNAMFKLRPEREAQMKIDEINLQLASRKMSLSDSERADLEAKVKLRYQQKLADQEYLKIADQIVGPAEKYAAALKASDILLKQGVINQNQHTQAVRRAYVEYEKALSPMYEVLKGLQNEIQLLGFLGPQLEIQQQMQQITNQLDEKGIQLSKEKKETLETLLTYLNREKSIQTELNNIYRETIGAQTDLINKNIALNKAYQQGMLSTDAYKTKVAQLKVEMSNVRLSSGKGGFGDFLTASIGKMIDGYKGALSGLSSAFGDFFSKIQDGFANSIGRAIVYSENLNDALMNIGKEALSCLISALIKLGIQFLITQIMGQTTAAAGVAALAAMGGAVAAAWAPAAALVSLASWGANAAPAMAALEGTVALSSGLALASTLTGAAGFEEGGYTGNLPTNKIAGVVHGREYVFDAESTNRIGVETLESIRRGAKNVTSNGGSTKAGLATNVVIYNYGTSKTFETQITPEEVRIIARDEAKGVVHRDAPGVIASDMHNPNSSTSKALNRNYKVARNR